MARDQHTRSVDASHGCRVQVKAVRVEVEGQAVESVNDLGHKCPPVTMMGDDRVVAFVDEDIVTGSPGCPEHRPDRFNRILHGEIDQHVGEKSCNTNLGLGHPDQHRRTEQVHHDEGAGHGREPQ